MLPHNISRDSQIALYLRHDENQWHDSFNLNLSQYTFKNLNQLYLLHVHLTLSATDNLQFINVSGGGGGGGGKLPL